HSSDVHKRALETESETCVRNTSISANIEIPLVVLDILDPQFAHSPPQYIVAFFALASPDDFSNLRYQDIHRAHGFAVLVHTHVERLDLRRIVVQDDGLLENLLGQEAFVFGLKIQSPAHRIFKWLFGLFEDPYGLAVR